MSKTTACKRARVPSSGHSDDENHEFSGTSIHAALSTLLHGEKFSDMTINCKGREFKVHRAIVCPQSNVFDKAMSSNWKEAMAQTIELKEDDPAVVELFLEFLYTGNYTDTVNPTWDKPSVTAMMDPETVRQTLQQPACGGLEIPTFHDNALFNEPDQEWQPPAEEVEEPEEEYEDDENNEDSSENSDGHDYQEGKTNVMTMEDVATISDKGGLRLIAELRDDMKLPLRLYVMADKYDVPALRLLARNRFYRAAELVWEKAEHFPDIVDELYETTRSNDTAMREIVCRLVSERILDPEVRERMRPVMEKHGEFAFGVLEYAIRSKMVLH